MTTSRTRRELGWARVLQRFARPDDVIERTRWLFLLLVSFSMVASVVPTLLNEGPVSLVLACSAWVVLTVSWSCGYLRGGAPVALDAMDTVAILALAAAAPVPAQVLGFTFGMLWFRSMYGSTVRAVARCVLYQAGIFTGVVLWSTVPGHVGVPDYPTVVSSFPLMFVNVLVIRYLLKSLQAGVEAGQRDAALASLGADLLVETGARDLYERAGRTVEQLCEATPGMRLLVAVQDGEVVRVVNACGPFALPPSELDVETLVHGVGGEPTVSETAALDVAAGARCAWEWLPLTPITGSGWIVVGAPRKVLATGMVAVRLMVGQVALATDNARARTALTEQAEMLTVQARTDALTGLANRSAFTATVTQALLVPDPDGRTTLLFVDLDDFKPVNDRYGHAVGDELLRHVADRLRLGVRDRDVCARLGGDEFAVLLTTTTPEAAERTALRLVEALSTPARLDGHLIRVGASIGVAHVSPGETSCDDVLARADLAMYTAKSRGKNHVQVFDPTQRAVASPSSPRAPVAASS